MADVATIPAAPIEFIDLGAQRRRIGARMDEAIRRVVDHGRFILGPEVAEGLYFVSRKISAAQFVRRCDVVRHGCMAKI